MSLTNPIKSNPHPNATSPLAIAIDNLTQPETVTFLTALGLGFITVCKIIYNRYRLHLAWQDCVVDLVPPS